MIYIRRVSGNSMDPTLRPGTVVCAIKLNYKPGDVVIAEVRGLDIIKRVSQIDGHIVRLVSDNREEGMDEVVTHGYILGKVIYPRRLKKRG